MTHKPVIIVTGANGQLGKELVLYKQDKFRIVGLSRTELDITDYAQCINVLTKYNPYAIIHCAAYTAVDKAESDKDEAFRVNETATRFIAQVAKQLGSKLIYISTDYVFDGNSERPYDEYDEVNPQTIYGASKLAGERAVTDIMSNYFVVRTSWVYGKYGSNFVKTMLSLAKQGKSLKVVHDQIGSPTYTLDLAKFLLELVESDIYGIYHASNSGICSWFEFAKEIFNQSNLEVEIEPCKTLEFPRPAPRPTYSVLAHNQIKKHGFNSIRPWREGLSDFLAKHEF